MSVTRASIDRRLDQLSARTAEAKREAMQGTKALVLASVAFMSGLWLWRRSRIRRARRLLRQSATL